MLHWLEKPGRFSRNVCREEELRGLYQIVAAARFLSRGLVTYDFLSEIFKDFGHEILDARQDDVPRHLRGENKDACLSKWS